MGNVMMMIVKYCCLPWTLNLSYYCSRTACESMLLRCYVASTVLQLLKPCRIACRIVPWTILHQHAHAHSLQQVTWCCRQTPVCCSGVPPCDRRRLRHLCRWSARLDTSVAAAVCWWWSAHSCCCLPLRAGPVGCVAAVGGCKHCTSHSPILTLHRQHAIPAGCCWA
jgi:hypothetical protein